MAPATDLTERKTLTAGGSTLSSTETRVVRGFQLEIVEGPCTGIRWDSVSDRCTIGSSKTCNLVIDEPTVSRFHCKITINGRHALIRDQSSVNGVFVDGVRVCEGYLRTGSLIRLGNTVVHFAFMGAGVAIPQSQRSRFGLMVGTSAAMQSAFASLEGAAAASGLNLLLQGPTGTGKSIAAESVHMESARKDGPFFAVNCSAIPANLLESALFGHASGAFTGAREHKGAFEAADGGTLFLDEIGELPLELQPALLTVLDRGQFRRVGCNRLREVDVRVISATNRDVRARINADRFREDLFHRIAVLTIELPPLRECLDDLPLLVKELLKSSRQDPTQEQMDRLLAEPSLARLREHDWPGNIRELRNYLERALAFSAMPPHPVPVSDSPSQPQKAPASTVAIDIDLSYREAKRQILHKFHQVYLGELLRQNNGNVAQTAAAADIRREYCHRLIREHGVRRTPTDIDHDGAS